MSLARELPYLAVIALIGAIGVAGGSGAQGPWGPTGSPAVRTVRYESNYYYTLRVPADWDRDRDDEELADGTISTRWTLGRGASFKVTRTGATKGQDLEPVDLARLARRPYLGGGARDYDEVESRPDYAVGTWRWRFRLEDRDIEKVVWFFTPAGCDNVYAAIGSAPPGEFGGYLKAFQAAAKSMTFEEC